MFTFPIIIHLCSTVCIRRLLFCLQKETNRFKSERAWLNVVNEEEFARAANADLENARRKREICEQKLAKFNVNDQEVNQLNEEIRQLEQRLANEKQQSTEEKQKYRQVLNQVADNERNLKRVDLKMTTTRESIRILQESIEAERNR